jgi:hypothetical protein
MYICIYKGNIVDHAISVGNWMFVKYSSPFQAERASINPVLFLGPGSNTMLSVTRLNAPLARTLNLHIDSKGTYIYIYVYIYTYIYIYIYVYICKYVCI